jgi:nucleoside-diphosphate-sugar epimerase
VTCVLITGASGFVGQVVCECVLNFGMKVRESYRSTSSQSRVPAGVDKVHIPSVDGATDWSSALLGVNVIVPTAAAYMSCVMDPRLFHTL